MFCSRVIGNLRALRATASASERCFPNFFPRPRCLSSPSAGNPTPRASTEHSDLKSFLEYAARVSLDRESTVFVGTHYEYVAKNALARFGMSLERAGGRLDKGIDLLGSWTLPTLPKEHSLRVLVQCKALARKLGPQYVREMEGAFIGAPASWRITGDNENPSNVFALLVASKEATKGVRDAIARSRQAMGFAMVEPDGRVCQIFWNKAAALKGLDGIKVATRRINASLGVNASDDEAGTQEEIVLTWRGETITVSQE